LPAPQLRHEARPTSSPRPERRLQSKSPFPLSLLPTRQSARSCSRWPPSSLHLPLSWQFLPRGARRTAPEPPQRSSVSADKAQPPKLTRPAAPLQSPQDNRASVCQGLAPASERQSKRHHRHDPNPQPLLHSATPASARS